MDGAARDDHEPERRIETEGMWTKEEMTSQQKVRWDGSVETPDDEDTGEETSSSAGEKVRTSSIEPWR